MGQRWIAFLVLFFSFNMGIAAAAQTISLNEKSIPLKDVFGVIEKQTGYLVVYPKEILNHSDPVTVNVSGMPLRNFLSLVLNNRQLEFTIENKSILVSKTPEKANQGTGTAVQRSFGSLTNSISGVVLSARGEGVANATVSIKGTGRGTTADINGRFSLTGIPNGGTVVVSAIGFQSIEIQFRENTPYKSRGAGEISKRGSEEYVIQLAESAAKMDDVVITGYFSRNKESFTGASVAYTAEEIQRANPVNVLAAISILEPSFKIVENTLAGSDPNVIPDFVVRGESSLPDLEGEFKGNPNNPVFILDGFEVSAERVFDLDPTQVSSITILKDAASTAIYGSRASNGVVVIESKKPSAGLMNVMYNVDMSFTTPDLRDYHLLDASQKLELEKAAGYYDRTGSVSDDEKRQDEYNEKLKLIARGNNTYWLNKPLQTAIGQKHSLSLDGSQSSIRYELNVQYEKAPGVMIGSARNKTGLGTMLQYRHRNITFQNRLLYTNVKGINSPYGQFAQYARINPYFRYDDDQGNYLKKFATGTWFINVANPLYNLNLNTIDETSYSEFINNFSMDWAINTKFRLKANLALSEKKDEGVIFKSADHTDFLSYNIPSANRRGQYRSQEGKQFSYDGKVQLSYLNNFGKHLINTGVAANIQESNREAYSLLVEGFPADKLDYLIFGLQYPEGSRPVGSDDISRLIGFVSSTNYSYDNRYLLDFSFRTDASSKFGADNRWAPFWSVGTGWNIHNESFFSPVAGMDKFRLRASYGVTGSQAFNPFQAMTRYQYYLTDIYNYQMGATMVALGNPNLKWQQTHQMNLGVDLGFLKRFEITANYYRNNSKSLLADITLPPSLGFSVYKENVGEMLNRGFDANLKATAYKGKDAYVNFVVGVIKNTNTIEKISNSLKAWNDNQDNTLSNKPRVRFIEGQSINTIWGVPSVGINPANGKEIFITPDGKRTEVWRPEYQQPIGVTDPDFEGNAGINGGYKGLSLNLYFRYRKGGQMYNSTLVERVENADKRYNTDVRVLEQRWQKPGDITFYKDVQNNAITQATSRFVEDYSFIQLSSMNVSYDLGKNLVSKLRMKMARLSFSMNDVIRISTVEMERGIVYPFSASFRTSLRVMF